MNIPIRPPSSSISTQVNALRYNLKVIGVSWRNSFRPVAHPRNRLKTAGNHLVHRSQSCENSQVDNQLSRPGDARRSEQACRNTDCSMRSSRQPLRSVWKRMRGRRFKAPLPRCGNSSLAKPSPLRKLPWDREYFSWSQGVSDISDYFDGNVPEVMRPYLLDFEPIPWADEVLANWHSE